MGGWYVGNTAVVMWLNGLPEAKAVLGDLDFFREKGGLYQYQLGKIGKITIFKNVCAGLLKALKRKIAFKIRKKVRTDSKNFHQYSFTFYLHIIRLLFIGNLHSHVVPLKKAKEDFIVLQNPVYYPNINPVEFYHGMSLFKNSKIIFVVRDELMQLNDIINDNQHLHTKDTKFREGTKYMAPNERVITLTKKIHDGRIKLINEYGERCVVVNFEQFLQSEKYRNTLCKRLGLSNISSTYNLNNSLPNVKKSISHKTSTFISKHPEVLEKMKKMNLELCNIKNSQ